jgi:hypothetical protein
MVPDGFLFVKFHLGDFYSNSSKVVKFWLKLDKNHEDLQVCIYIYTHLRDPGVDGRIILRWSFRKWDVGVWTGSSWLRIETGGGHV